MRNAKSTSLRFHSINVPSEWGQLLTVTLLTFYLVSIQLMSPASGDLKWLGIDNDFEKWGFHSINVPSEWGLHSSLTRLLLKE